MFWEIAILAGGCFWCIEDAFSALPGVQSAVSGYTGGHLQNPTYHDVTSGMSGHYEVIKVEYDPKVINYQQILGHYWKLIDPTDAGGQFYDRGPQYRTAIFYLDPEQQKAAIESKANAEKALGQKIVTEILPAATFYIAEEYHQDYSKKEPTRYSIYKHGSGREEKLRDIWGK